MRFQTWSLLSLVALLAACGGGGGTTDPDTGVNPPPTSGTTRLVSATAEKGPFVIGSSVTVNRLDAMAQPTASTLTTETDDNLGSFSFSIEPGPVSISVDGFHFNEITGSLANGRLTLRAIYEVQDTASQRAHVNLLTHLIHLRVEMLVQAGSSITDAVQTAQSEFTDQLSPIFGPFSPDNFVNYSVYASDSTSSDGAAYILAVSAGIYQFAINRGGTGGFDAELALIVNNLSDDFADGVINLQWILDGIDSASVQIDPAQLSSNLLDHAASVGFTAEPADASLFIDTDRDGIMNAVDDDDDNDGLTDDVDPDPLTPANRPPTISGELERYVIPGLAYQDFLEATDPDGDALTISAYSIPAGLDIVPAIYPPGFDLDLLLPAPTLSGHTVMVGGFTRRPPGVYPITITVSDGTDTATYETELEVIDTSETPILKTHPPTVGFRGETYSAALESTNPQGVSLSWTLENGPEWLGIDPVTGELSGTIPLDHRTVLEPLPNDPAEQQLELCRAKFLGEGWREGCPFDVVGIGIDDGTIKTTWPVFIDLFDAGEVQGPVLDGNDFHHSDAINVLIDALDHVYVVGSSNGGMDGSNGLGLDDVFIKKLDQRQVEQWTRVIGTSGIDRVAAAVMDANDDIYLYVYSNGDWRQLVGDASNPTGNKRLIIKVTTSGELIWATELADSTNIFLDTLPAWLNLPHLAVLPGGGVRLLVNGNLVDVDSLGNATDHASVSFGYDIKRIAVADDGSTILTGTTSLTRLDASGTELWTTALDADPQINWTGKSISFDASGGIIVLGDGFHSSLFGYGWFLARYAVDGTRTWFKGFITDDDQKSQELGPNGLAIDSNGEIIVAGRMWLESFTQDPFGGKYDTVSKFDSSGTLLWYRKLWRNAPPPDELSIASNSSNDLVLVGSGERAAVVDYPGQFECSLQEPCQRLLRLATNDYANLMDFDGEGGMLIYLLMLDSSGAEK